MVIIMVCFVINRSSIVICYHPDRLMRIISVQSGTFWVLVAVGFLFEQKLHWSYKDFTLLCKYPVTRCFIRC